MDEILKRDQNHVTVLAGVTDDVDQDIMMLRVDPITKRLLVKSAGDTNEIPVSIQVACSDLTTTITTGTSKAYFRAPYAFTLTEVRASLLTGQTAGSLFTVNIKDNGSSILSTKITIDNNETTSTTATTPPVISSSNIVDDRIITIDVDAVGTGSPVGLIVTLIGTRNV